MVDNIQVRIWRPERQFGVDILIHGRLFDTGERVIFDVATGEWRLAAPNAYVQQPSMHLDDNILMAMDAALSEYRPKASNADERLAAALEAHLDREAGAADRALAIVEHLVGMRDQAFPPGAGLHAVPDLDPAAS